MNNRFLTFLIFILLFIFPVTAKAQEEELMKAKVSEALSKGEPLVTLSVTALATIDEDNVPQARSDALQAAFHDIVIKATEQVVPADRLQELSEVIENKIYKRSKNFIHHFKPLKSKIIETQYHLPVEVTLSLKELKRALIENKILSFDVSTKIIYLVNVKRFQEAEWIRGVLEKDERLKRLVETYQKKGVLHLKIETSSSLEEVMAQLTRAKSDPAAPDFKVNITAGGLSGILEIIFL